MNGGYQSRPLPPRMSGPTAAPASSPQAVPWGPRDVWVGVGVAALSLAAGWGLAFLVRALSVDPNVDLWVALFPNLFELLFIAVAWWFSVRKYQVSLRALGFVGFRPSILALGFALLWAVYLVVGAYNYLIQGFGLEMQTDVTPVLEELASPWPLFFTAAVVAPVSEEVFFRGFVFAGLRSRYGWRGAAAISSILFAVAHAQLAFIPPAFLLGFLFAYLYERSGSLWPALILHMAVNTLALSVAMAIA